MYRFPKRGMLAHWLLSESEPGLCITWAVTEGPAVSGGQKPGGSENPALRSRWEGVWGEAV